MLNPKIVKDQTMNKTLNASMITGFITTALFATLQFGCNHNQPAKLHGEEFTSDLDSTSTGKLAQAQCAAGAMQDGMLYDINFHGDKLNSLGQGKLDLILKGTPLGDQVLVYLNMPHDLVALRQAAVAAYLKDAGVGDTRIVIAEGPNMNKSVPTAYNLSHIYKADGGSFTGEAARDDGGSSAVGMGAGK